MSLENMHDVATPFLRGLTTVEVSDDEHKKLLQLGFRPHNFQTDIGSIRVWEVKGSGRLPTAVCLHGFSFQSTDFAPLLAGLMQSTRGVMAVDLPGHGGSRLRSSELTHAALMRGVQMALDSVIDEPIVLYGHSVGGFAALRYALARSDKIARLVLHAPSGAAMSQSELAHVLGLFEVDDQESARKLVAHLWEANPDTRLEVLATRWRNRLNNATLRSLLRTRVAGDSLKASDLSKLHVPTLVLWAERDQVLPRSGLAFFRGLARGRLEVVTLVGVTAPPAWRWRKSPKRYGRFRRTKRVIRRRIRNDRSDSSLR